MSLVANILAFCGYILFAISSILKKKKKILLFQSGNSIFSSIAQGLLGAYSGMIQDIVCLLRNIFIIADKNTKFLNFLFIILGVSLGLIFNQNGWFGILPVFASLQYSIIILLPNSKELIIKISIAISCVCWTIYGFVIFLIPTIIFNSLTFVLCVISIIRIMINKDNKNFIEKGV